MFFWRQKISLAAHHIMVRLFGSFKEMWHFGRGNYMLEGEANPSISSQHSIECR